MTGFLENVLCISAVVLRLKILNIFQKCLGIIHIINNIKKTIKMIPINNLIILIRVDDVDDDESKLLVSV